MQTLSTITIYSHLKRKYINCKPAFLFMWAIVWSSIKQNHLNMIVEAHANYHRVKGGVNPSRLGISQREYRETPMASLETPESLQTVGGSRIPEVNPCKHRKTQSSWLGQTRNSIGLREQWPLHHSARDWLTEVSSLKIPNCMQFLLQDI